MRSIIIVSVLTTILRVVSYPRFLFSYWSCKAVSDPRIPRILSTLPRTSEKNRQG